MIAEFSCTGATTDIFNLKSVTLDPYPLKRGHRFDLHLEGVTSKRTTLPHNKYIQYIHTLTHIHTVGKEIVVDSCMNLTMTWSPASGMTVTIIKETLDLCDLITEMSTKCPLLPGSHKFHYVGTFQSMLPKVSQKVKKLTRK